MNYYRSKLTGKIFTESFLQTFGDVAKDDRGMHIIVDVVEPIESPSVIDCIRHNSWNVAVLRYRELHPESSWDEACKAVGVIKKDIGKAQKHE